MKKRKKITMNTGTETIPVVNVKANNKKKETNLSSSSLPSSLQCSSSFVMLVSEK